MRRQGATARRYAKALFGAARESGRPDAVADELRGVLDAAGSDRRLQEFLNRPWIKRPTKRAVAMALAERLGCSSIVGDFLGLVAARGRMDHLAAITRVYQDLLDEERGRVRAQVRSAVAFTDAEREQLATRLARIAGREVMVEISVDPTLLGGFVAQMDSLVLDGSLDGQLARLRARLVRA